MTNAENDLNVVKARVSALGFSFLTIKLQERTCVGSKQGQTYTVIQISSPSVFGLHAFEAAAIGRALKDANITTPVVTY